MAEKLRAISLGGLGEIGKNMMLFEYGNTLLVVDAGIMFPEHDMLGIDLVIPDFTYLRQNARRVAAVIITHGHEDHIGALPYLLNDVLPASTPVYATRLAGGLIQAKLAEYPGREALNLRRILPGESFTVGPFRVEFLAITHSIPDGVGLALHTPVGVVVHTGDFKFDYTPVRGGQPGFARLGELGAQGVLALFSDSTGAERAGYTPSEAVIEPAFDRIFRNAQGRIIVATFASLLSRVQQVFDAAQQHGRAVAVAGYSMVKTTEMARELGHLQVPPDLLIDLGEALRLPDERVVIITTGSQGQPEAALARMAEGTHRQIEVKPGDTVVISSTPIPGNEEGVARVINRLIARGAEVIYPPLMPVHVSGHASQEELKLMLSLIRPRFFVPIHGELRHLHAHARLAERLGVPRENIFVVENGVVLEFARDTAQAAERAPSGNVFVQGSGVGDIGPKVMAEREILARDGFVIAVIPVNPDTGEPNGRPELVSRGFVYLRESGELLDRAAERAWAALQGSGLRRRQAIIERAQDALSRFFYEETRRRPMVVGVVAQRAG
ncbi:MAG: Ribonuclease J 1 [Chloroflexi bacterium ADurb.Bin325]|nr:MAG: Ribonuclease J 1 [Chloroflexi bacterium ADurb.Bin325]